MTDIYVVVAKNDKPGWRGWTDPKGEIVFETYVKEATLENAQARAAAFTGKFGKCRIAKLQFIDEEVKS